jgi:hypothetical protein
VSNPLPNPFAFRELEAGPRRDVAREFYELVQDLNWLAEGAKKIAFLQKLLEARDAALEAASDMLR